MKTSPPSSKPSGRAAHDRRGARFLALFLVLTIPGCLLPPSRPKPGEELHHHTARKIEGPVQKWNPIWWLKNSDTTEPPDDYRPGEPNRRSLWYWRNPFHNFTFYVIGVADKDFIRHGKHPSGVFTDGYGWNWAVIECGWWRLPFISYHGRHVKFYALWREAGNFGLKWNYMRDGNKVAEKRERKKAAERAGANAAKP